MADPEVTVIVVNWNTREMTLACLDSLYAQTTETAFETILVDNGSADGSAEAIARQFPQVRLMAESVNHGFGKANNIAAEQAKGRYLLLLNSDTVVLDHAVDRLVAFARTRPAARIWGGRALFGDKSLNIGSAWGAQTLWSATCFALGLTKLFPKSEFFNPEAMGGWRRDTEREVDIIAGCFLLIETALWEELKGFDPSFFMYGEEADLCRRGKILGARPRITPDATIIHYEGASATLRADPTIRIMRAKIALAHRSMPASKASAVRHLFWVGAGLRHSLYGVAGMLAGRAKPHAALWRDVFARRAEWYSAPVW